MTILLDHRHVSPKPIPIIIIINHLNITMSICRWNTNIFPTLPFKLNKTIELYAFAIEKTTLKNVSRCIIIVDAKTKLYSTNIYNTSRFQNKFNKYSSFHLLCSNNSNW